MSKCELCGRDDGLVTAILPIPQPNGSIVTLACEKCMMESRTYCRKHGQIHMGFLDGTTACRQCIAEILSDYSSEADHITQGILQSVHEGEVERLVCLAETAGRFSCEPISLSVLRFVVTKAVRTGQSVENIIVQLVADKSARFIMN